MAEIRNLLSRGTFRVILTEEIPRCANVLRGLFVLAIKSSESGQVKFKARYVISGHRDKLKHYMVHSSKTLQFSSIPFLFSSSSMHELDVWTTDVRQAYLQASEPITRDVFLRNPAPEFELPAEKSLLLIKPLYGLHELGDIWHRTLDKHHRTTLGMVSLQSDPSLYAHTSNARLSGLLSTYVDDILRCGTR